VRASSRFKTAIIQDIIMSGSIEKRQHDALQQKSAIAEAIIDGKGIDEKGGVPLNVGSLKQFLSNSVV
jgi:orotate phosphoribosyltransferase-like protein